MKTKYILMVTVLLFILLSIVVIYICCIHQRANLPLQKSMSEFDPYHSSVRWIGNGTIDELSGKKVIAIAFCNLSHTDPPVWYSFKEVRDPEKVSQMVNTLLKSKRGKQPGRVKWVSAIRFVFKDNTGLTIPYYFYREKGSSTSSSESQSWVVFYGKDWISHELNKYFE
jgi:hypothetical protein